MEQSLEGGGCKLAHHFGGAGKQFERQEGMCGEEPWQLSAGGSP
jgi:hypothetical protein